MNLQTYYRLQFAAATHYYNFTGDDIDGGICELLTDGAINYANDCEAGDFHAAELALESTLSYVNTELDEDGYEDYTEGFAECISLALEGCYDNDIDFEAGIDFGTDEFAA